jgi:hypothetical protein
MKRAGTLIVHGGPHKTKMLKKLYREQFVTNSVENKSGKFNNIIQQTLISSLERLDFTNTDDDHDILELG